jgi:UDP-glucuronate 4-epimerase
MSNTIVVTGAAGFIGSKTAERLLNAGNQVIGIDNLNDAYDPRLKEWRLARLQAQPNFSFYPADISRRQSLQTLWENLSDVSAVINLAARAGVRQSVENPQVYIDTNITGTLNLLDVCRDHGVRKFVLASTSSLYGLHNPMPYREDANTDYPLSPYAASKKGAEALCYTYHSLYQIDVTIFRYFTVYGPAGRPDMSIFRFIQWINEGYPVTLYGDGQQSRDFTYVEDIARGTTLGLNLNGFQIVNLGSDQPVVLMDMLRFIEEQLDAEARLIHKPRHMADMQATWADITQARTLLGWQPETSYQQGVKNAIAWYLENRDWAKDIRTD